MSSTASGEVDQSSPTKTGSAFWQRFFWIAVLGLFIVLSIVNILAWRRLAPLREQVTDLQKTHNKQLFDQAQTTVVNSQFDHAIKECRGSNTALLAMFRWCKSRSDFASLVSGDEIISYSPTYASNDDWTWAYVPKGKHVLKFAAAKFAKGSASTFLKADTSQIAAQSIELAAESVVEIEIAKTDRSEPRPLQISIRDLDGAVQKIEIPEILRGAGGNWEGLRSGVRKLPREIGPLRGMLEGRLGARFNSEYTTPVNDVILRSHEEQHETDTGTIENRRVAFRCWIESDSVPCMSVIRIADELRDFSISNTDVLYLDNMMKPISTFEPYDGSGRYFFRPGFLRSQVR